MAAADLLVVGAGTIRAENPSVTVPQEWSQRRVAEGRSPQPSRLVISPGLTISPDCRAARRNDARLFVAARADAIAERGAAFEGKATLRLSGGTRAATDRRAGREAWLAAGVSSVWAAGARTRSSSSRTWWTPCRSQFLRS
jgi:riboflavin biosynthesis pyrimidine reductase